MGPRGAKLLNGSAVTLVLALVGGVYALGQFRGEIPTRLANVESAQASTKVEQESQNKEIRENRERLIKLEGTTDATKKNTEEILEILRGSTNDGGSN